MKNDAGWAESLHRVELVCQNCGDDQLHELRYAGRLLASSTCLKCGFVLRHDDTDLRKAYLRDLEQRVRTKPRRMLTRAAHHPAKFTRGLPGSILAKPVRLAEEVRPLLSRLFSNHAPH